MFYCVFFLMIQRPPISTRTYQLFPYSPLFRSQFSRFPKTFQHMVVGASLRKINRPMQINAPAHAPALAARDQLPPPARAPALSLAAPASSRGPGPDVEIGRAHV